MTTPEPEVTLLPCPFCGSAGHKELRANGWIIRCSARFDTCKVNSRTHHCPTLAEAITAWNTRTTASKSPPAAPSVSGEAVEGILRNVVLSAFDSTADCDVSLDCLRDAMEEIDWKEPLAAIATLTNPSPAQPASSATSAGDEGLREAVGRFRELFAHALETPGYGTDHESREEIDAHFRELDAALAAPSPDASDADDVVAIFRQRIEAGREDDMVTWAGSVADAEALLSRRSPVAKEVDPSPVSGGAQFTPETVRQMQPHKDAATAIRSDKEIGT